MGAAASSGRPHWTLLVIPIGIVSTLGLIGTALTPPLAARHPLLLLALEARDRNLLLARHVGVVPYVLVGNARRLCTDPLFYLLGRHYGPTAVVWLKDHGGGAIVAATERAFRRAAYPMLVIFPGAVVCTLAGDVGIPPTLFGVIVVARTLAAVLLIRWVGNIFASPIGAARPLQPQPRRRHTHKPCRRRRLGYRGAGKTPTRPRRRRVHRSRFR
jgi:hypothetical protein